MNTLAEGNDFLFFSKKRHFRNRRPDSRKTGTCALSLRFPEKCKQLPIMAMPVQREYNWHLDMERKKSSGIFPVKRGGEP
jgi:hypothetical protein